MNGCRQHVPKVHRQKRALVFLVSALPWLMLLSGCGQNGGGSLSGDPIGLRGGGKVLQSRSNMKMLRDALKEHHQQHGVWPQQLSDVSHRVPGFKACLHNPITGDDPGYQYVQPPEGCPPDTVILYQLRDGVADVSLDVARVGG